MPATFAVEGIGVTLDGIAVMREGEWLGDVRKPPSGAPSGFWLATSRWTADGVETQTGSPIGRAGLAWPTRRHALIEVVKRAQALGKVPGPPEGWMP